MSRGFESIGRVEIWFSDGEDKPLVYSTMFNSAYVAIIFKSEFTAAVEFDVAAAKRDIQAIRPEMEVFKVSPKTGKGMTEYLESLETRRIFSLAAGGAAK
jgi:hydrogenase nickel incorporation protein HypB